MPTWMTTAFFWTGAVVWALLALFLLALLPRLCWTLFPDCEDCKNHFLWFQVRWRTFYGEELEDWDEDEHSIFDRVNMRLCRKCLDARYDAIEAREAVEDAKLAIFGES